MNITIDELWDSALSLPDKDRLELAEALLSSIPADTGVPCDSSWVEEVKRRTSRIDAGESTLTPWHEALERAWKKAAEARGG